MSPLRFTPLAAQMRGAGERIVCLHSSTATSGQWRALQEFMASRWELLAPDLHGHGRSPGFAPSARSALQADAAAVATLAGIGARSVHLVGHSWGAAVALQIALRFPQQVKSLTLYEPVAFGLMAPGEAARGEIDDIAASVASLVRAGRLDDAARVFVGYWGGARAWATLGGGQRQALAARMPVVPRHFDALFGLDWDAAMLQRLVRMPVLLMQGSATRASARRVGELLAAALPQAQRVLLEGAGHMGPLTHAGTVVRWMALHLDPHLAGCAQLV